MEMKAYLGNFDEAINYFNIVNKLNPENVVADKSISLIHKYKSKDDPHLKLMEQKLKNGVSKENLRHLYFALGKAYEDLKEYKKSFSYLNLGNKITDKEFNYNIDNQKKLFSDIKELFINFDPTKNLKSKKKIIFVIGMPRSGTTLTEQILSSHKKVYGAGELSFLEFAVKENLKLNETYVAFGKTNFYNGTFSMPHPDLTIKRTSKQTSLCPTANISFYRKTR